MVAPTEALPRQVLGKRLRDDTQSATPIKKRKETNSYPALESIQLSPTDASSEEASQPSTTDAGLISQNSVLEERVATCRSKINPVDSVKINFLRDLGNYVPLGSLTLRPSIGGGAYLHQKEWIESSSEYNCGLWLAFHDYLTPKDGYPAFSARKLAETQWVRVFARKHQEHSDFATLRIYVLPDDVGRRYVDRQALRNLRGFLGHLVTKLDMSFEAWEGQNRVAHEAAHYEVEADNDDSLFYLFNTLPSPAPGPSPVSCPIANDAIDSVLVSSRLPGLNTQLYPYQKRTVATMIKREVEPRRALDPRFQPLTGPTGQTFYYDNLTIMLLRDGREYSEACGGILGESMGLGKTLICLATIIATKGNWPVIPPEYSIDLLPVRPKVGSLMQMAAAAVGRTQVPWRAMLQDSSRNGEDHRNCLAMLENNVGSYTISPPEVKYSRRSSVIPKGTTIRLSSATLIIVPQNLISQWRKEISTHVENDRLKILYVDISNDIPIPSTNKLLPYDIILMSRQRFETEMVPSESAIAYSKAKKAKGGCLCSLDEDCHCSTSDEYRTPLKDLHFLRIIMDEGHEFSSSGRGGTAYRALRSLHVDRKWIVSGTPAGGLLGVEVGIAAHETSESLDDDLSGNHKSNRDVLEARRKESALAQERKDLEKLGILVCGFLQVKPWANSKEDDPASWQKYVMPHNDGRRKARSLGTLLQSLVVRHRIEHIEADIQLPPLHNRVVYLQPSWHDKLSINLFILFLIANAVTSERRDEDYMFHTKNRRQLQTLIHNLRHSGFYWTGIAPEDVVKTIQVSKKYLQEHEDGSSCAEADRKLLEQAIHVGEAVLSSASSRSFAEFHEMGVFVDALPDKGQSILKLSHSSTFHDLDIIGDPRIVFGLRIDDSDYPAVRSAWSIVPNQESELLLTGATQLAKAQNWVDTHLYATDLVIGLAGVGSTTMQKLRQGSTDSVPGQALKPPPLRKKHRSDLQGVPRLTNDRTVSRAKAGFPSKNGKKVQSSSASPIMSDANESASLKPALKSALKTSATKEPVELLPTHSLLGNTRICGTASAKLSYLLDKVSVLHHDEKILIFYEGDSIAWYISQMLDVLGIRYLIYTKTLSQRRQTAYINTFNTTETFRVLLMNVYEAAHGLHIASASRVFFVNPVWQPNVEAQAIKRAHRIGQTRPVYVETLILKDTLEDQMLQRRKGMTTQEHQKAERGPLDDDTMSTIIKHAQFILLPEDEIHDTGKQIARLEIPQQLFARVGKGEGVIDDPDADLIFTEDMPLSKKEQRKHDRKNTRNAKEATISPLPRSPPPGPAEQANGLFSGSHQLNDVSTGASGPSSRKRKIIDEHAPDLDAPPSPTRRMPPASLSHHNVNNSTTSSTNHISFASNSQNDPPSLFGGDSSAGMSTLKRKSDSEHAPKLDEQPASTRRMSPSGLAFQSTPSTSGTPQRGGTLHPSVQQSAALHEPSKPRPTKKVGFALEKNKIEPNHSIGGSNSSAGTSSFVAYSSSALSS